MPTPSYRLPEGCILETPDALTLAGVKNFEKRLHRRLLPKLNMFSMFEIVYVKTGSLGPHVLGRYIETTCKHPIVLLDLANNRALATAQRINPWAVLRTTILHELGHAIQEFHGRPFDNQEAEYFALSFCELGQIRRFWDEPPAKVVGDVPFRVRTDLRS